MIDKIKVILAICISTFLLGIGMTYAWYTWQSDSNTNISFKIMSMADVSFATGNDINVDDLAPVLDYKDGKMTSFSINNKKEQTFTGMVNLEITTIDENLRVEDFKYVLLSSNDNNSFTEIANGNFKDQGPQTITIKEIEVNPGITYYQFIIYIDGNMENNINMMNKQFVAKLMVEVKGVSDILDSCADEEWVSGAEGLYKDGNGNCRYIDNLHINK